MRPKITFFDTKPYDKEIYKPLAEKMGFDIRFVFYHLTEDNILLAQDADVVVIFVNDILNEKVINKLHSYGVKLVALRCAGFNNVDIRAAQDKIKVVRVPAYSPNAIAEHTVALMLSLNRKIHRAYFRTRDANFSLNGLMGYNLNGKTAGVIGTGKIGKALIKILRGFEMDVLAYDPFPDEKYAAKLGYTYTDLEIGRAHV